jgi:hypothetical protein
MKAIFLERVSLLQLRNQHLPLLQQIVRIALGQQSLVEFIDVFQDFLQGPNTLQDQLLVFPIFFQVSFAVRGRSVDSW